MLNVPLSEVEYSPLEVLPGFLGTRGVVCELLAFLFSGKNSYPAVSTGAIGHIVKLYRDGADEWDKIVRLGRGMVTVVRSVMVTGGRKRKYKLDA